MDQEQPGNGIESGGEPAPVPTAPESGSSVIDLSPDWVVPGVERGSALTEGLSLLASGLESLRLVGASGWAVGDGAVRDGVRDLDTVRQQVEHLWLGLVHELDGRPGAVPGSRTGGVAQRFLTGGLNRSPGRARKDVAAARALFRPDPDGADVDGSDPDSPDHYGPDHYGPDPRVRGSLTHPRARLAQVGAAFEAGDISREHLDAAVECLGNVPRQLARAVDEESGLSGRHRVDQFMAEQARQFDPRRLRGLAKHPSPSWTRTGRSPGSTPTPTCGGNCG